MDNKIIYLTPDEQVALLLLANNRSQREVHKQCAHAMPISGLAFFLAEIRRKTGILDLSLGRQCREYMEKYSAAMALPPLTDTQQRFARYYIEGLDIGALCPEEKDIPGEIHKLLERCAIFAGDYRTQKIQLKIYLAAFHTPEAANLISPLSLRILRKWAECGDYYQTSDEIGGPYPPEYIKTVVKKSCVLLGLTSKGRNAQLNLLRAYFSQLDARSNAEATPQAPDPMGDPAF